MSKIMILTAEKTGTGHKSSANAIEKKLVAMGYEVKQINCFEMMGNLGRKMEAAYIPLTTKHPGLWKISHSFSQVFTNTLHNFMYSKSRKCLLKEIMDFSPDLIISVHCMFTKAISKLLKKNNLNIPFMINVIDLVNPPRVWQDKRADMSFMPTEVAREQYIKKGFDPDKLIVSGFPIREDIVTLKEPKKIAGTLKILMVNPSVNLKKNIRFAREVSRLDNVEIKFVCGRDERLYKALTEEKQKHNLDKIEVLGFVKNMNELLLDAHILLTKAGPNMILEGTRSGTAVIVTGHIPGQEAKNYEYITKNGYGVKCENPKKIYTLIKEMVSSGKINEYLKNTLNSDCNDGAKIIAENIDKYLKFKKNS